MSLLTHALRSIFRPSRGSAAILPPSEDADARSAPAVDEPPAWRLLAGQTGVQALEYADVARPALHRFFGHAPRRLLDIGCAAGAVGAGLKQDIPGLWVWGCELNEHAAAIAAGRLDHITTSARADWGAADLDLLKSVDTVLLLDVLEHMYNPWAELEFL